MYVGLWSRVAGVERDALTAALERRAVVQGTLMRSTLHAVAPGDWWPFALATRAERRDRFLRSRRGELSARDLAAAARVVRRRLAAGPVHRREAEVLVGRKRIDGVRLWVDLLRVPPGGTWEHPRADLYALAEAELGPSDLTPARALAHLVASYLRGFGPATRQDVASFTGVGLTRLGRTFAHMELREVGRLGGEELLDVSDGALPDPETPAPVRFLGVWDAALLVHARRTGILPEDLRPRVFSTRRPHGTATFLVDGRVAGEWRRESGRIALEFYTPADRATRRAVEEEAARLAEFHGRGA